MIYAWNRTSAVDKSVGPDPWVGIPPLRIDPYGQFLERICDYSTGLKELPLRNVENERAFNTNRFNFFIYMHALTR